MSHLISKYAAACGLHIDKPWVNERFFALPFTKYVTIQTGSGQGAKNYDYFFEVISQLKPTLDRHGISIVHLGAKDDPQLQNVHDCRGKTSIAQSHYVIKKALLHLGGDSWLAHCAGWNGIPLVSLYGSTSVQNHGPYWRNHDKTTLLSSHRNGGVPTYSSNEQPKTVNLIAPESVVAAVLSLLNLPPAPVVASRFLGILYPTAIFEVVPNSYPAANVLPNVPMVVRMDYLFNEDVLVKLIQTGRKVNIVTNKAINPQILANFRASIIGYSHEVDMSCSPEYTALVRNIVPQHSFFTKEGDEKRLADLRFRFFDYCNIIKVNDLQKKDYLDEALKYLNLPEEKRLDLVGEVEENRLMFKSNKYLFSDGRIFLSAAHMKAGKDTPEFSQNNAALIDSPDLWRDLNNFYLYRA